MAKITENIANTMKKSECSQNADREIQVKLKQSSGKFQANFREMLEKFKRNSEKFQSRQRKI
jgi:hypothetical protein